MSRLDMAKARLDTALESLENAAASLGDRGKDTASAEQRIAALEAEREDLMARIAALEEELLSLTSMTEEVEGRLDGAIGEIRAALAR